MSKSALLVDTNNLHYRVRKLYSKKLYYPHYLEKATKIAGGNIDEKIAYVTYIDNSVDGFVNNLENLGFTVITHPPVKRIMFGRECRMYDWTPQLIVDALEAKHNGFDQIIIGSSSFDLEPLLRAVDCTIFAAGLTTTAKELCDKFVQITSRMLC